MKLPIGVQSFERIRSDGYLYIDKTKWLWELVSSGKYYFLSRPRRFGKSLFLSTLKAYFEGKRALFDGLYVAGEESEWSVSPVLYLDLNVGLYESYEGLEEVLRSHLSQWEEAYGLKRTTEDVALRFKAVIRGVAENTGRRVAILVDEYDKPLLQTMESGLLQDRCRALLKAFYGNLKTCDEYIRFAMLTGVTQFSHVSVFSDLNNLADISQLPQFASLCGITEAELHRVLDERVRQLASRNSLTQEEAYQRLKTYYDGYCFYPGAEGIYNPFSLFNALQYGVFKNFWYETGTPTFLIRLILSDGYPIRDASSGTLQVKSLSVRTEWKDNPAALLYQTGYLTIKSYDSEFASYRLGFPNREVEESFLGYLLQQYLGANEEKTSSYIEYFVSDLREGRVDDFVRRLQSFFADTPYDLIRDVENHYQNVLFTLCRLLGYFVRAEYRTSSGRIDMLVQTDKSIYVFECKFNQSAQVALAQINAKDYLLPFRLDGKALYKVGINFSKQTRNIDAWLCEKE